MASVQCMLHEAGRVSRTRPALVGHDIQIAYGELDLMVSATAQLLRAAGLERGQRVALYLEDGWALATLLLGLIRIGAVPAPLSTRLPVQAVAQRLATLDARCLIARVSDASRAKLPEIVCLDPDGLVSRGLTSGQAADLFTMPLDQPATLVFTSGSAGTPKAALLTYGNHYYSAYGANLNVRLQSADCWLLSLPLYHVGGLGILFRCIQSGAAVALMDRGESLADALASFPVTHLSVVPTQLHRLLQAGVPDAVRARLKAVVVGGAPAAPALLQAAQAAGWPVMPSYGLTEMNAQVTAAPLHAPAGKLGTAGRVLRYRQLRVADDGEILLRGETLFAGYVDAGVVERPVDAEGWFATGDVGRLDEDGFLTVLGRKDDRFISGGENVAPEEIERALLVLPGVRQALVVPVADAEYGQRPVAFVDGADDLDAGALRAALRSVLPAYMLPVAFYPWPEDLAPEHGMKVSRQAFAERVPGTGRMRE